MKAAARDSGLGAAGASVLGFIALAQWLLFSVVARHGFDLTDEGFYVLNYRHWDAAPAFTFFGAYWQGAYRVFGESLWAMRMLGMVVLSLTGFWCARALMLSEQGPRSRAAPTDLVVASIAGAVTTLSYYGGFVVPYTPSYNTLALVCALASIALTMSVARALLTDPAKPGPRAFALGAVISIGIANKFSAGALFAGLDGLIALALLWRMVPLHGVGKAVLWVVAGFAANLALLALIDPDPLTRFRHGVAIQLALLPRDLVAEYVSFLSTDLPGGLREAAAILVWPLAFACVVAAAGRLLGRAAQADSVAIAGFVVLGMFIGFIRHRGFRIEVLSLMAVLLWAWWFWSTRQGPAADTSRRRQIIVAGAMLVMPFAYSFGTNNAMLHHMAMAAVFPSLVIVARLRALRAQGTVKPWALLVSLCAVALVPPEVFVRQWTDASYTYRLATPLVGQTVPLPRNPANVEVLVDAGTAETVGAFVRLAGGAGLRPGDPMLDFTGQVPGLVALSGGKPIGASWIAGGGSFDGPAAARLAVSMVDLVALRSAWLIASDDSFTRVAGWQEIVAARLGGAFPYDEAGRMTLPDPSSPDKPARMTLSLWKPRSAMP